MDEDPFLRTIGGVPVNYFILKHREKYPFLDIEGIIREHNI